MIDELFQHRGHNKGVRHLLGLHGLQPFFGIELTQDSDLPSVPQRGHDVHRAGNMVERRAQQ